MLHIGKKFQQTINPKPNDMVVVYSSRYDGYYRAKVMGPYVDDHTKFKCNLSDIGMVDIIPPKHIFVLPSHLSLTKVSRTVPKQYLY